MRTPTANLTLWFLGLLPSAIFLVTSTETEWSSTAASLNTLGRLTGIAGLSFFLVAAMLSSRVPGFDRKFGGLTKLWFTHHQLAAVSFLLLLTHPLLLAFSGMAVSIDAGMSVLFPGSNPAPVLIGWLALVVMMIFLAPSFAFFGEPRYQRWKLLHKLAGVALVLALIHSFMLARQIHFLWQSILWSLYTGLALLAMLFRWGFSKRSWFKRHGQLRYQVVGASKPLSNVVELELQSQPQQARLAYEAGQFIYFTPYDKQLAAGYAEEHPYTISSAPEEANLRIAVKDLGDSSRALQSIQIGSLVRVEGPYGAFFPSGDCTESELWIAGGIGITPFLSRARHLAAKASKVDVHCILCVQDEARALYHDELKNIADRLPGFVLTMHYFYREGAINTAFLQVHCPDFMGRSCYVCGPPPMLGCVQGILRSSGVPSKRIHTEEFNLL
jgi:predicted ferric reductase